MNTICSRCILDTTVPEIEFDKEGVCNYCKLQEVLEKEYPQGKEAEKNLEQLLREIKEKGKNKQYDCIIGVSGGTDSSYMLYLAVKNGLRPLAVHFDNGWNSEIAVSNIKNLCSKLNIDLDTYVVDWEEFKNLQISFLKASVPDAEIPTDVGILGALFRAAEKEKIGYIFNGHSFRTEGIAPVGWTYMDGRYINSVQKRYGTVKLKSFPNFTLWHLFYYTFIKPIKIIPFLNYFDYTKEKAQKILSKEVRWRNYGGHHHESIYTQFFQSYYLPKKFNIDKRKRELSAKIRSKVLNREKALVEIQRNPYRYDPEIVEYAINKLGLSKKEFYEILKAKNKSFKKYPTYYSFMTFFKFPIKMAYRLNIIPKLLYLKYSVLLS